jgi:hypothetical protein
LRNLLSNSELSPFSENPFRFVWFLFAFLCNNPPASLVGISCGLFDGGTIGGPDIPCLASSREEAA